MKLTTYILIGALIIHVGAGLLLLYVNFVTLVLPYFLYKVCVP